MMTMYISPYRRMATFREAMNRLMAETMNETSAPEREMLLSVDVQDAENEYLIRALVPSLEADDLDIEALNNTVTIRGEFKDCADENTKPLTCELPQGRFGRVITLPTVLDASHIEASLKNGVLTLKVPKAEAHRPRTVKVTTPE
jgi:HSP20 family protein